MIIIAILLYGAILLSQAFAEMKKVDEAELARTNASVTGTSVNDQTAGVEKATARQDMVQTFTASDKGEAFISPSTKVMEGIGISLNVRGQETFRFLVGGISTTTTGGITNVK